MTDYVNIWVRLNKYKIDKNEYRRLLNKKFFKYHERTISSNDKHISFVFPVSPSDIYLLKCPRSNLFIYTDNLPPKIRRADEEARRSARARALISINS